MQIETTEGLEQNLVAVHKLLVRKACSVQSKFRPLPTVGHFKVYGKCFDFPGNVICQRRVIVTTIHGLCVAVIECFLKNGIISETVHVCEDGIIVL